MSDNIKIMNIGNGKKGRPLTHDCKNNKKYFKDYFDKTNIDYVCECGITIKYYSIRKHILTEKHKHIMKLKDLEKQINPENKEIIDKNTNEKNITIVFREKKQD